MFSQSHHVASIIDPDIYYAPLLYLYPVSTAPIIKMTLLQVYVFAGVVDECAFIAEKAHDLVQEQWN